MYLHLSCSAVLDAFTAYKFSCDNQSADLRFSYLTGKLDAFSELRTLVESVMIVCGHNMVVESGFSAMKVTETEYTNALTSEVYDALRIIQEFWDRDSFETYVVPAELHQLIKISSKAYKDLTKSKNAANTRKRAYADDLRSELQVFKRRTPGAVQKDISSTNDELKKAKELVEHLEKKKSKLEADRDSVAVSFVNQL